MTMGRRETGGEGVADRRDRRPSFLMTLSKQQYNNYGKNAEVSMAMDTSWVGCMGTAWVGAN